MRVGVMDSVREIGSKIVDVIVRVLQSHTPVWIQMDSD
jgi:hypothetical protein